MQMAPTASGGVTASPGAQDATAMAAGPTTPEEPAVPPGPPLYAVDTERRLIALTFDDGPNGAYTDAVLATLARHDVSATFYVVGQQAAANPTAVREMHDAGHEVGNHSWDHAQLDALSRPQIRSELRATSDVIERITGDRPDTFRAPYGAHGGMVDTVGRVQGMRDVLWSVDTVDWARPGAQAISSAAINGAHPGGIILMHDGGGDRSQTVAALDRTITTLKQRGYEFVTVPELVAAGEAG